jgi:hypothetical protein
LANVTVALATGSPVEVRVRAALERVRARHDLARFERTAELRIEEGVIPHSHPTLTLSERYGDEDDRLLATYLHEQMHWWSMECPGAQDGRDEEVFNQLRIDFPLPTDPPEGCGNELSNLIHLHVCWLELEAVATLLGNDRATEVLSSTPYYLAVYRTVLRERRQLAARFATSGMGLPE